jgi:ABC-type transport system substrate-binding protein
MGWIVLRGSRSALSLCCIVLFVFLLIPIGTSVDIQNDIRHGPFISKAVYKVIVGDDQTALALQAGVVDIGSIGYLPVSTIYADPDIDVLESPRNGYSCITINCDKYPLNNSVFRRAFAFAFDKSKAVDYVYLGHGFPHDSIVPSISRWCAEDLLEYHYYEADIERGNALLDELGFTLNTTTGFREAPNGEPFNVIVYYSPSSPLKAGKIAQLACEALDALYVDYYTYDDWGWWPWVLPEDYDMVVMGQNFEYDTLIWEDHRSNYRNDSLTYWIEKYQDGRTYEEVFEAATEVQKNIHYNLPRLVVCQSNYFEAGRNDQFQGYVEDQSRYFSGPWTLRKIQQLNGTYGGTFSLALGQEPDSFNIYTTNSLYSRKILENLYSSLYSRSPNMDTIPDLAESMIVETHSDNPSVPQNHTRFTFDILQNATWSDGVPLTAEDIAFTFIYQLESSFYGNPAADSLRDLVSVYAPSPNRVVFEFSSESYWHFYNIAYDYIIPKHIFTTIGYEGWNTWNPVFGQDEPHVTCGPFVFTDFDYSDETYELTVNPDYHWLPQRPPLSPSVNNTSTPLTTPDSIFEIVSIALSTTYVVVTAGIIVLLIYDRKHSE